MKYVIFLGDGMADYPVAELGGRTPLMAANKPAMDWIARHGRTGLFQTIEPDMLTGSAIANLSVLGYNGMQLFQGTEGRGVLEAASMGIELAEDDLAMRVNIICVEGGAIRSHSAGHISNEEARILIDDAREHFRRWNISLHRGLSYRHVLVLPGAEFRLECCPPHDYVGRLWRELPVRALTKEGRATAELLNRFIEESGRLLEKHPVNRRRLENGQQSANLLWPWAPGKKPKIRTIAERFGISGAAITAVDLVKGLAIYAGMKPVPVEGATGLYDTNYEGKADAALEALEEVDFVYIHVEAPDEASHERNLSLKIRCIEDLDRRLILRVMDGLAGKGWEYTVALLPDHPTPVAQGNHTRDPVPVAIYSPGNPPDAVERYDEESVAGGALGLLRGKQFIETFFNKKESGT